MNKFITQVLSIMSSAKANCTRTKTLRKLEKHFTQSVRALHIFNHRFLLMGL